ncbi:hypothetical protein QL285_040355 [Trifolium repens]|nr:hypothetical protein QL285_040355 [Trifolium repens]
MDQVIVCPACGTTGCSYPSRKKWGLVNGENIGVGEILRIIGQPHNRRNFKFFCVCISHNITQGETATTFFLHKSYATRLLTLLFFWGQTLTIVPTLQDQMINNIVDL